jgi:hypothetical protein
MPVPVRTARRVGMDPQLAGVLGHLAVASPLAGLIVGGLWVLLSKLPTLADAWERYSTTRWKNKLRKLTLSPKATPEQREYAQSKLDSYDVAGMATKAEIANAEPPPEPRQQSRWRWWKPD